LWFHAQRLPQRFDELTLLQHDNLIASEHLPQLVGGQHHYVLDKLVLNLHPRSQNT
jgi:hypothetical protein